MNAWQCDRCRKTSRDGGVDTPPKNWVPVQLGAGEFTWRGVYCDECDDSMCEWILGAAS